MTEFDSIEIKTFSHLFSHRLGHRAHTVFVGVHLPNSRRHSHRRHKHHHKEGERLSEYDRPSEYYLLKGNYIVSRKKKFLPHKPVAVLPVYSSNTFTPIQSEPKLVRIYSFNIYIFM